MTEPRPVAVSPALAAAAAGLAGVLALAASPGALPAELGAAVHGGFAWLCHQLPDRSPHLDGVPWALCHRCVGILGGALVGLLAAPALASRTVGWLERMRPGRLVVASLMPLAADWALTAFGVWANTPASRLATGALFGLAAGLVLALALRPRTTRSLPSPNLLAS